MVELFGVGRVEVASPRDLLNSPAGYERTKELRYWNCRVDDLTYAAKESRMIKCPMCKRIRQKNG